MTTAEKAKAQQTDVLCVGAGISSLAMAKYLQDNAISDYLLVEVSTES